MMRIPVAEPDLTGLERGYLLEAYDSGWISSRGPFISRFEDLFRSYIGTKHAITTSNGTVSLYLILEALGIKKGDEVIVPSLTYIASVNAIRFVGAEPVFVDVDRGSWNIDPEKLEDLISDRTKAIMGVHLYGNPMNIKPILDICRKYDILLVEDAAEALGSEHGDRKVGSFGVAGSFSFFGNKTVTTGEGGMVVTDDDELYERMMAIKNQGNSKVKRYWHDIIGYNFRMTNLQAAIGVGQMERIDELVGRKIRNADNYHRYLDPALIKPPSTIENGLHSHWMYTILLKNIVGTEERDRIMNRLEEDFGIETRPMFYPIHQMDMYKDAKRGILRTTEEIYYKGLTLPSSTHLDEEKIGYVSETLNSLLAGSK